MTIRWSRRWLRRSRRATRWSSCSPQEAAGRRRVSSTRTATRSAAVRSGLTARCIDADTRLYLPMPFFWVGGFGSGVLSALLAGATLVTEEIPQPETTLRLLERERVSLFRGWPDQAEALARQSAVCRSRSVRVAAGQSGGAAAARPTGGSRCAGEVVRDDRVLRALLRLSRRHRYAAIRMGKLRQAVRRHAGADRRPRHRPAAFPRAPSA